MSNRSSQLPEPRPKQPSHPPQPSQQDPPSNQPDSKAIALPLPNFSERFTSSPRFGWEGIPRPSEFFRRLMSFTSDSVFDLDPALDATPLSAAAEGIPIALDAIVNDVTSSIHHYDAVPHTVADAIEWIISDIAMLGIMAEATWRTQRENDPTDLKQLYLHHISQVFSELGLGSEPDDDLLGLQAAINVGTCVLNEIFREEICPPERRPRKQEAK